MATGSVSRKKYQIAGQNPVQGKSLSTGSPALEIKSHTAGVHMLDAIDIKILRILQEDATLPVAEIGKAVGLSTTPCWRRIQKLEEAGYIQKRVALLDPKKVGAGVTVFVFISTSQHTLEWLERFHAVIVDFPEVVEFYRMSGEIDYLLRVVVPDIDAYDRFYKKLISKIELSNVSSAFAMEQIKFTTALPLDYAEVER
jgi:Lrp/AsnC family transcriptional regulator